MIKITMRLHSEPFRHLQNGEKRVECRLNDKKRQALKEGDTIEFLLRPNEVEKLEKKIVALHVFPNFEAMFEKFPEERINNVYQYYTPEEEKKWGVVAIELI